MQRGGEFIREDVRPSESAQPRADVRVRVCIVLHLGGAERILADGNDDHCIVHAWLPVESDHIGRLKYINAHLFAHA